MAWAHDRAHAPAIRTPDQRLRVFVSSTLRELADERRAARAAIERLRLAPVMFELGARPHPPRELYRVLPRAVRRLRRHLRRELRLGRTRRGRSRASRTSTTSPRRRCRSSSTSRRPTHRDERLNELIDRIRSDDTAAYLPVRDGRPSSRSRSPATSRPFSPSASTSRARRAAAEAGDRRRPPSRGSRRRTRAIDRPRARARRGARSARSGDSRVVTLLGPGGIGKSRLAIEVARACGGSLPDGTSFVPLEGVLEPGCCCRPSRTRSASATPARRRSKSASRARCRAAHADRARQLRADRRCRPGAGSASASAPMAGSCRRVAV